MFNDIHAPGARLKYTFNWAVWLNNELIGTSTWTVPSGLTKVAEGNTTTQTWLIVSGGTEGETYSLINHIVLQGTNALEDKRTLSLKVQYL